MTVLTIDHHCLTDARVKGAGHRVRPEHHSGLPSGINTFGRLFDREIDTGFFPAQVYVMPGRGTGNGLTHGVGDFEECFGRYLVRIGVGCPLSEDESYSRAAVQAGNNLLYSAILANKGERRTPFQEDVGELSSTLQCFFQNRGKINIAIIYLPSADCITNLFINF